MCIVIYTENIILSFKIYVFRYLAFNSQGHFLKESYTDIMYLTIIYFCREFELITLSFLAHPLITIIIKKKNELFRHQMKWGNQYLH